MHFSHAKALLAILAAASAVNAHAGFSNFYVDGVDQGDAVCVRMNPDGNTWSFPLEDLSSSDMACGVGGTKGVNRICEVNDGATMTFEWREQANDPSKGVIDSSHMGPCAVYMKKVDDASTDGAAGDGWFKIWDEGYDEQAQKWCTIKLIDAKGLLSVQIPKGLVGGHYLVRPELLALHNADKGDPQYYSGCAQVFLKSSGSLVPSSTVSIPGYVSISDKADSYNIWSIPLSLPYPIPGPQVASLVSSGSTTQTQLNTGLKPTGCLLEVGSNWCGVEVPDYNDEQGCWASGQNCWDQVDKCWSNAPPTGGDDCRLFEAKCQNINDQCSASNFQGPPNKGKVLTPVRSTISPPAPLGPTAGGGSGSGSTAAAQPTTSTAASPSSGSGSGYGSGSPAAPTTTMATSYVSSPAKPISTVATTGGPAPTSTASPVQGEEPEDEGDDEDNEDEDADEGDDGDDDDDDDTNEEPTATSTSSAPGSSFTPVYYRGGRWKHWKVHAHHRKGKWNH